MRIFNRRNNNGSNTTEANALVQTGWAVVQPGVNNAATFTVNFPATYSNVPIVLAISGGDTNTTTSTLGSGGFNAKRASTEVNSVSTSGFVGVIFTIDNTNWSAGNSVYIHWIAIGV